MRYESSTWWLFLAFHVQVKFLSLELMFHYVTIIFSIQHFCVVKQLIVSFCLTPHLSFIAFYWFESPTPPSPDSCLFTPTLSRDLIEGNHSDKKPPTMMLLCCVHIHVCVCVCCVLMCAYVRGGGSSLILPLTNPTTSFPLSLSPAPLKCHAALSTHLPCYPPNKPFV